MDAETREYMQMLDHRLEKVEGKVDTLLVVLQQGTGVWRFIQWLGAFAIGFAALYQFFKDYLK